MHFTTHRAVTGALQAASLIRWGWRRWCAGAASATPTLPQMPNASVDCAARFDSEIAPSQTLPRSASAASAAARKLARPVALSLASLVAVPVLMVTGVVAAQAWVGQDYNSKFWADRLATMVRPAVSDVAGMPLGFVPPAEPGDLDAEYAANPGQVPEYCIDMALAREDRHHADWPRYFQGVDLGGVVRAAMTGKGGASTIPMQIARQLAPEWAKQRPRWQRKVLEAGAAKAVLDLHGNDPRAAARTYLAIAPFAVAYGDVRGIASAAQALWGVRVERLTPAQCAILVVMLPTRPSLLDDSAKAKAAWAQRQRLAAALLIQLHMDDNAQIQALAKLDLPPRRPLLAGLPQAANYNFGALTRRLVMPQLSLIAGDAAPTRSSVPADVPGADAQ